MVDLSTVMLNYQRVSNQFGLANQWALGTIMGTINHDIDIISGYNHGTFLWFHWGFTVSPQMVQSCKSTISWGLSNQLWFIGNTYKWSIGSQGIQSLWTLGFSCCERYGIWGNNHANPWHRGGYPIHYHIIHIWGMYMDDK